MPTASPSRSSPTTRWSWSTTGAASPWASCRSTTSRRPRSCSPCCTPAASSAAPATRCPAACTAWVSLSSTRCPNGSSSTSIVDGFHWHQRFERGVPVAPLEKLEKLDKNAPTGTTVSFMPDPDVFEEVEYDYRVLAQRLRETAFLTKNLRIELVDERAEGETTVFQYAGGVRDFVDYINRDKDPVHRTVIYFDNETPDGQVEVAMQWNSSYNDSIFTFANNINTTEGGAHLSGFRGALTRTINDYARQKGLLKEKEENLSGEDVREGLSAIVSVKLKNPQFEGQTKTKLGNTEIRTLVETTVNAKLAEFLEENPAEGAPDRRQVGQRGAGTQRRAQGARPHAPQGPARRLHPARQAGRLLHPRPAPLRALPGRGRLGRRLGQAGPRPQLPGHPAAARQDHQRREGAHRQDAAEQRDPHHDQRHGHRHRRRVRPDPGALPQDHHHDRRRRRRLAHPHAHPHLPVPPHDAAGRCRLHLHRPAAALPPEAGQPGDLHPQGGAARRHPPARPPRADQGREHRHRLQLLRDQVPALPQALQRIRGLGQEAQEPVRRRARRLAQERPHDRGRRPHLRGPRRGAARRHRQALRHRRARRRRRGPGRRHPAGRAQERPGRQPAHPLRRPVGARVPEPQARARAGPRDGRPAALHTCASATARPRP